MIGAKLFLVTYMAIDKETALKMTEEYVKRALSNECTGHDWYHSYRVRRNAVGICKKEGGDLFVVELASLLHDISDWKFNSGDDKAGATIAREWLKRLDLDQAIIQHVSEIISDMPFRGYGVESKMKTKEGMIVQDADRLDAIGAIGIARAFAYGGHKRRMIYDPSVKPRTYKSFDDYKKNKSHTINHFHEKLLLLKDLMNTETAKKMAEERHKFMTAFLERFQGEWNGKY